MELETAAISGSYSTAYFGEKFNKNKYVNTRNELSFYIPYETIMSKKEFVFLYHENSTDIYTNSTIMSISENYTLDDVSKEASGYRNYFYMFKDVYFPSAMNFVLMPGFQISWSYDIDVPIIAQFQEEYITQLFIRFHKHDELYHKKSTIIIIYYKPNSP